MSKLPARLLHQSATATTRERALSGLRSVGLVAFLLLSAAAPAVAQKAFSSLEEQMSGKEFEAAGLQKLTPEELESLNDWIRSRSLATLETARSTVSGDGARGLDRRSSIKDMKRTPITSRLVGTFTGWDGQTVFKLENGMIWAQTDKDKFFIKPIENPVVTIKPKSFGTWRLYVEDYNSNCRVRRIE